MESAQSSRKCAIPQELEALRKLYEDVMSDNEADLEVQSLMSRITETDSDRLDEDCASVVSGSWSKMTAYKNVNRYLRKADKSLGYQNGLVQKAYTHIEKGTTLGSNVLRKSSRFLKLLSDFVKLASKCSYRF